MVFTVPTLSQLAHVLAIRSEQHSLFSIGLLSNGLLLGAVVLTAISYAETHFMKATRLLRLRLVSIPSSS